MQDAPTKGIPPQPRLCSLCGKTVPDDATAHGYYDDGGQLVGVAIVKGKRTMHRCGEKFIVPKGR